MSDPAYLLESEARAVRKTGMFPRLRHSADSLGLPAWRPMLRYVAELHERCVRPAREPFAYDWEEIGPGYCYGPAFGHWDIVHAILDSLPDEPTHARHQILNNLAAQQPDGLVPGSIWLGKPVPHFDKKAGHPSVWPIAVDDYVALTGDSSLIDECLDPLVRLIGWYENHRRAEGEGFFYTDILNHVWESGVDEGIRFDQYATGPFACIDATSHVCALYETAARWLGPRGDHFARRAGELRLFIRDRLFHQDTGFFHDIWSMNDATPPLAFEGMWPLVLGLATPEQATRVIDENLLNPRRFLTAHPLATIGVEDPRFELRMWRGPAWNSMTYWAARGCLRYGRPDAALRLLEPALDCSARAFDLTGKVWEFYHPHGGDPRDVQRKPDTPFNTPCPDYLGHNPLFAMARLWEQCKA